MGIHMAPGVAILIGAVGTWVIAAAALWDRFSTFFLKPKLSITSDPPNTPEGASEL
jgi:hypothetical protein